jgi:hypothetical protein
MARRKSLRSQLYRAARDVGNVQAARGGPTSYGKRVVTRKVYLTSPSQDPSRTRLYSCGDLFHTSARTAAERCG